jgi:hypothetical protein
MRPAPLAAALAALACAPRLSGDGLRAEPLEVDGWRLLVVHGPEDAADLPEVLAALREALPLATRFAGLRHPVTVTLHPTHESLEAAARADGLEWLRAWARYDTLELQAPRTWPDGAGPRRLRDLLAHELAHCAMYQSAGSEWFWRQKGIPDWFSEGLAVVSSGESRVHPGPRELWAFYAASDRVSGAARRAGDPAPGGDPLSSPDAFKVRDHELVYGAAESAFRFLVVRYGEARVRQVLTRMGEGGFFEGAFRGAIGLSPEAFLADFRRYLTWRGWDGEGVTRRAGPG